MSNIPPLKVFQHKVKVAELKKRLDETILTRDPAELKIVLEEVGDRMMGALGTSPLGLN